MDTNAGLLGVVTVSAAGTNPEFPIPANVDREMFLGFVIVDVSVSAY